MTTPALILGDFNLVAAQVEDLADELGGTFVLGRGVDHGILLGDAKVHSVRRDLPRYRSDHAPLLITIQLGTGLYVRVLWWNVYVGVRPHRVRDAVQELANTHRPDLIVLGEVKRCREVLGEIEPYQHMQGRGGEALSMAVLVRRGIEVLGRGWLRMDESWIGPKHDLPHGPRAYPRVRVADRTGEHRLKVLGVHFPTGGYHGRNSDAVRESVRRVLTWGRKTQEDHRV